jgi:hypothetical protein
MAPSMGDEIRTRAEGFTVARAAGWWMACWFMILPGCGSSGSSPSGGPNQDDASTDHFSRPPEDAPDRWTSPGDSAASDAMASDGGTSDANTQDSEATDVVASDRRASDAETSDGGAFDSRASDGMVSDGRTSEAGTPDTGAPDAVASVVHVDDGFDATSTAYKPLFADYPAGSETFYELASGVRALPAPLVGSGFMLSGINHSDDLWMSVARVIDGADGVVPNRDYDIAMRLSIASNAQSGCVGVGGAPGEGVAIKGGVVGIEPNSTNVAGRMVFNLEKGQQGQVGAEAMSFGNLANGDPCGSPARYVLLQRTASSSSPVRSDGAGRLWMYVGTDSGFEARSTYYVDRIEVTLTPR